MDSQWYKKAVMGRNGYEPNVDLNLKLSLPNTESDPTRIAQNAATIPRINASRFDSLNFSGPYTDQALNQNQMANGGAGITMNLDQMNIGGVGGGLENSHGGENYTNKTNMQTAWTPEVLNHFMDSTGLSRLSAPATVVPAAPFIDQYLSDFFSGQLPVLAMQDYNLFGNFEIGSSSSGTSNKRPNFPFPVKSCSNLRCGAEETPMWRKGPLGPKTLCNACGIKYRKKMQRRRAMEEAARRSLRPDA